MSEALTPPEGWAPLGAFSMAVIQGDGRIVHLKGQVALDRDGRVVAPATCARRSGRRSATFATYSPRRADRSRT